MADPYLLSGFLSVSAYSPSFPPSVKMACDRPLTADRQDSGAYRIAGNVDELGQAGAYRVRLYERVSGRFLRETFSGSDGAYSFEYLPNRPQGYFLLAFDHGADPVNAAVADLVSPEPMP